MQNQSPYFDWLCVYNQVIKMCLHFAFEIVKQFGKIIVDKRQADYAVQVIMWISNDYTYILWKKGTTFSEITYKILITNIKIK